MPSLLLQKPSFKSTSKQHSECLKRRISLWKDGDFDALVREARTIQSKLKSSNSSRSPEHLAKTFSKLMLQGKTHAALKLLEKGASNGILGLSDDVISNLKSKHPDAADADESVLLKGDVPFVDPVMFEHIDESTISKAALRTRGAGGPSGLDADGWRRMLVSRNYGKYGVELRKSIATMAKRLSTHEFNDFSSLEPYVSCRLIPLDKNPGVRPIGIGEVLRRIVGKAIISVIKPEILESSGSLQLCAGLPSGCEAAVHAMTEIYERDSTDAILLVDASNAFNSLNRKVLLHNIRYLCPPMATYVRNCYGVPSRLFITGGKKLPQQKERLKGILLQCQLTQ